MLNAAGGGAQAPHGQDDAYRAVVSIEHVQNSLRPIERTIARETSPKNIARQAGEFHQRHRA